MKRWREKLEIWAMAVAYAERGYRETAMGFLEELRKNKEYRDKARDVTTKRAAHRLQNYKM
jgi:hypothetical protein